MNFIDPTGLTAFCEALKKIKDSKNQFTDGSLLKPSKATQEQNVLDSLGLPVETADGVDLQYFLIAYNATHSMGNILGAFAAAGLDIYSWSGTAVTVIKNNQTFLEYLNDTVGDMRGTANGYQAGRAGIEKYYKRLCETECKK